VLALALICLLVWLVLVFGHGVFWSARTPLPVVAPAHWPDVVAIVPARDEAAMIAASIAGLLAQDYPGRLDVVLVDDHSSDATASVARSAALAAGASDRLSVVAARTLPRGWTGKVWAQAEGVASVAARAGQDSFIWLTDADILHAPGVLRSLVARALAEGRDLTSLMVRLRCTALAERALVPAFVFFFAMLYPFAWVNDPRRRTAAAAGGCMLVRYRALVRIGGMARIASALIDDCTLAAAIKEGGSIRLDLAPESYSLRPYEHWSDIWMMIARSAFTQLRHSVWLLAGCVLGMLLTYAAPPLLTLAYPQTAWPAAIAWLLMTVAYLPILRYYRVNVLYALALPLIAVFYLGATLDSARRYWTGQGGQWKGRLQARAIKDEPQDR
jgi:hopene-associated glycosyltransferase HpnB